MKRLVLVMVMTLCVLNGGILLGVLCESNSNVLPDVDNVGCVRAMECVVVTENNGLGTVEDESHNLWLLDDEGLAKGQVLCVWFDDMNTPKNLTDDVILDYCDVIVN